MSLLACNRNGCDNIMCDIISDRYGYICDDCYNELKEKAGTMSISYFMKSPKKSEHPTGARKKALEEIYDEFRFDRY